MLYREYDAAPVSTLDPPADHNDDPVRHEAEALYTALREEARPMGIVARFRALPTGRKMLGQCAPDVQATILQIGCEEIQGFAVRGGVGESRAYLARDVIGALLRRRIAASPRRVVAVLNACASVQASYQHWIPIRSLLRLISKPPTPDEVDALRRLQFRLEQTPSAEAGGLSSASTSC